ncbi:lysophospholipid acyltransferase family protein [Granulosicoccaceae sp. 1_MG-2023]|nr:lysophospholipid acyltransferase family protein [Granulosicoccaceae sp. 1_MG-2023]
MLCVESALTEKFPALTTTPALLRAPLIGGLRRLFRERSINRFLAQNTDARGFEFVERVLDYFELSYSASHRSRENIPVSGRVVIFANHPLGALDALCLIRLVSEVRRDVKVVANDLLARLEPLSPLLLPVDVLHGRTTRAQLEAIHRALQNEEVVIFFPAGEVSRARPAGVRDTKWNDGFVKFAARAGAPLLPCCIEARNSALFYSVSALSKPVSSLLLINEMFRQRRRSLPVTLGELIPAAALQRDTRDRSVLVKQLRKHLYRVGRNRKGLFPVERAIAHPESRQALRSEIRATRRLGETTDGMQICLLEQGAGSALLREIGRLREVSFRRVGEGTGARRDLDAFDADYSHLILWDDSELEIAGAYRIRQSATAGQALYTRTLFEFDEGFDAVLREGLELGRSFVQPAYWGSRALDYLWQGIGAYLCHHRHIRYLFGPVSISNSLPREAVNLLVCFYSLYFSEPGAPVRARLPYAMSRQERADLQRQFSGEDYRADLARLKSLLRHYGANIPTLYKQYPDVFEPEGVRFLAWNIDEDFASCVDGLLVADLNYLRKSRKKRYIDRHRADSAAVAGDG